MTHARQTVGEGSEASPGHPWPRQGIIGETPQSEAEGRSSPPYRR